jgi:hypothetical protein
MEYEIIMMLVNNLGQLDSSVFLTKTWCRFLGNKGGNKNQV